MSRPAVDATPAPTPARAPDCTSARDARIFQTAGVLMLLAAGLLALGSFSPWVSYVLPTGAALNRNAYEFGAGSSWTWFGPVILLGACLLAVFGTATLFHPWRPNVCMPFIPTILVVIEIADVWDGGFGHMKGASTTLGAGSFLCLAGLVLGVAASLCLLPAERARTR